MSLRMIALMLAIGAMATTSHAQVVNKKALTLEAAKKIVAAAEAEAKKKNARVVIAVVDDGGNLILLERLDDTQVASVEVGIGKARTAAIFRRPSKEFEDQIRAGRIAALAIPGATPLQGGVPVIFEGKVIGAIGVSGETPAQDEEIAIAGASAAKDFGAKSAGAMPSKITFLGKEKVAAAFEKGAPLIEVEGYKVHASRRDGAGMAEVHMRETDIIHVLEGAATFVTGGTVVDGKTTVPGEIRGTAIRDGETRRLTKGDVVIVPEGVPHWFKEVEAPFLYFVVKPISPSGGGK